ncbi:hypothetical protein GCM10023347_02120 [Streptomyces chumphonensis]|uniref:Beta-ketoacyl synthase n=1 Tax=Streptomyces chumphonensis TaxID=1214925 RepID=A0A927IFM5_9ACTN|nr:beta-ketoacyl synthase N-terminal-like domain-containing protein [Streptomyces chumphonensis]MBD3934576.1 beta-ketoacyl synthase [Streptomyces chumphonensis]
MSAPSVHVTGIGLALPGVTRAADLLRAAPGADAVSPAERIGRKGLRYKDRATQLALAAARDALREARLITEESETCALGASTAVVASSNLGNLDTVCRTAAEIAEQSVDGISPMGLPNASSNVVASSVAIRFALRGPNLMLCNGVTSGLDALRWGASLIASGRAARTVVIGVETRNEVTDALTGHAGPDVLDGAVAVVLERAVDARERGVVPLAELGAYTRGGSVAECVAALLPDDTGADVWFTPQGFDAELPVPATRGLARHDLSRNIGHASGALGVAQCAAAVGGFAGNDLGVALLTNGDDGSDAVAGLVLRAVRDAA